MGIKKLKIGVVILIFLIISIFIVLVVKNQYLNNFNLQDMVVFVDDYDNNLIEQPEYSEEIEKIKYECNEKATPIREEFSDFIDSCNLIIIDYFKDVYDVDVTSKINAIEILEVIYPENVSRMIGGTYSKDFPNTVFLFSDFLDNFIEEEKVDDLDIRSRDFSIKMFRNVYLHLAIHNLGFKSDYVFYNVTEAIDEYFIQQILVHNDIKYERMSDYYEIRNYVAKFVGVDMDFVREVLNNEVVMSEYFNNKFEDLSDVNYAWCYEKLIGLIRNGDVKDLNKVKHYTKLLIDEYCRMIKMK